MIFIIMKMTIHIGSYFNNNRHKDINKIEKVF